MGTSVLTAVEADAGLTRDEAGGLWMAGVPLETIAEAVGTPVWCYSAPVVRARYASLETAFRGLPHRVHYAVKANSNLAILHLLAELGAGADIVSGGEMLRALAGGFEPKDIVFSGVGKRDEELVAAMTCGVGQINVESISELHRLAVLSDLRSGTVNVGIRLNPDVTTETHPYISTGKGGLKFGIPIDQMSEALAIFDEAPGLELGGLAVHIGSQLLDPKPYVVALDRMLIELARVREAGHRPTVLDLGGGIGIRYHQEIPLDPVTWMAPLREALIRSECEVHIEPGRYLVGSAGVLLTSVVHRKHAGGREMVIVDAAMNDLIRPAFYQAWHEIVPVSGMNTAPVATDVVGPICETGDFFALDRQLPFVQAGERLAILGAGAYGFAMSSNYNTRARAAEVMVEQGRWAIVRPRERLIDLFHDEVADPFAEGPRDAS